MGYVHIPYNMSKSQDGQGGRLSVHMMFESLMSDWALVQPILFDTTMCDAAAKIALTLDVDNVPAEEADQTAEPEEDLEWAARDRWEAEPEAEQLHQQNAGQSAKGGSRSGLEPKVIGLLVNLYRYGGRYHDAELWNRVRRSADKLYYTRDNIHQQVDNAMAKRHGGF